MGASLLALAKSIYYPTWPHSLIANYNLLCPYNNPMEGDKSDL